METYIWKNCLYTGKDLSKIMKEKVSVYGLYDKT